MFTVPAIVAGLMVIVGILVSERVLSRLVDIQERHVSDLSGAYLDGLSSSIIPHVLREDVWEVFDALDRAGSRYDALKPTVTVVTTPDGRVIAASDPARVATLEPIPEAFTEPLNGTDFRIDDAAGRAYMHRTLLYQNQKVGAIYAVADVEHLLAERSEVTLALIATNGLLTVLLAGAGYLAVRHLVQPVRVLADHLHAGLSGRVQPIAGDRLPAPGSEARRLFDAYNALVRAEEEREALTLKLADEKRLASLGRLASGMAHEINNPLGGLFNALDTLKRHGETRAVRETSVSILKRGLQGIRKVVEATLQTYRPDMRERAFGPSDLDDLKYLIQPEIKRKCLTLDWDNRLSRSVTIPNAPLRQAVLNLLLNACAAVPERGRVGFEGWYDGERLHIRVMDSGPGLPGPAVDVLCASNPPSPIGTDTGLGLWMVRRLVSEIDGRINVGESPFGGASIEIEIATRTAGLEPGESTHAVV